MPHYYRLVDYDFFTTYLDLNSSIFCGFLGTHKFLQPLHGIVQCIANKPLKPAFSTHSLSLDPIQIHYNIFCISFPSTNAYFWKTLAIELVSSITSFPCAISCISNMFWYELEKVQMRELVQMSWISLPKLVVMKNLLVAQIQLVEWLLGLPLPLQSLQSW